MQMRIPKLNIDEFKDKKVLLMFDGLDEISNIESVIDRLDLKSIF